MQDGAGKEQENPYDGATGQRMPHASGGGNLSVCIAGAQMVTFFLSGPHLLTKLGSPKYCTVRSILRSAHTAGRRRQTLNNFWSERSRDGSLTVQT